MVIKGIQGPLGAIKTPNPSPKSPTNRPGTGPKNIPAKTQGMYVNEIAVPKIDIGIVITFNATLSAVKTAV